MRWRLGRTRETAHARSVSTYSVFPAVSLDKYYAHSTDKEAGSERKRCLIIRAAPSWTRLDQAASSWGELSITSGTQAETGGLAVGPLQRNDCRWTLGPIPLGSFPALSPSDSLGIKECAGFWGAAPRRGIAKWDVVVKAVPSTPHLQTPGVLWRHWRLHKC